MSDVKWDEIQPLEVSQEAIEQCILLLQKAGWMQEHDRILTAEKTGKWIPVSERLPEIGEIVLAYIDELGLIIRAKIVDTKDYRGERRIDWARVDKDPFFLSCYTITHWMPLPEPPKEEV